MTAAPGLMLPLMWPDHTTPQKKVDLVISGKARPYDITKVGRLKTLVVGHRHYRVRTITRNFGRQMVVSEVGKRPESIEEEKVELVEKREAEREKQGAEIRKGEKKGELVEEVKKEPRHTKDDLKIRVALLGCGISIVDGDPKELIYMSVHEINLELEKQVIDEAGTQDTDYYFSLDIGHAQIDNMLPKSFPVVFGPQRLFLKDKKDKQEDWEPFVQMKAQLTESKEGELTFRQFKSVQLQLSEMSAFVDQEILMNIVRVAMNISTSFKNDNLYMKNVEEEAKKPLDFPPIHLIMKALEPSLPAEPPLSIIGGDRLFIEFLNLAAIKIRLTLRLEKTAVDPTGPLAVVEVLYSVLATITNISDAPIYFRELVLTNNFTAPNALVTALRKNYTRQAVLQFYRLLGAIDIIGNPIGLVDQLGSGVFEFFNEPRKGIMKGPKEFAEGVGKGVKSLVTNVVGGSLNSVSRVTGSLYSLVKYVGDESKGKYRNVGGETVNDDAFRKPDNALTGALQGVKGGAMEVASGFAGIFTKPFKGAQNEGAKGFFKGLGQGLIGAITSPVTAALKLGTSVTQGIEGTVTKIGKGSIPQLGRIRFPRYITPASVMVTYDEELSEAKQLLDTLEGQKYAGENILLFALVHQKKNGKEPRFVVITEKRLLVLDGAKRVVARALHTMIAHAQLFAETDGRYILQIVRKDGAKLTFVGTEYPVMAKCVSYFPELKAVPKAAPAKLPGVGI